MAAPVRLGRKRPLPICPNPLFVSWLTEWRDEAASRGRRTQFVFQKALRSLRRYPLPLRSGKEARILRHFGDGLCRMLDQRLQQHLSSGGDHAPGSSGAENPTPEGPPAEVPDSSMPWVVELRLDQVHYTTFLQLSISSQLCRGSSHHLACFTGSIPAQSGKL